MDVFKRKTSFDPTINISSNKIKYDEQPSMEQKYIACMVLHALGDTIGFKNGEWEFKQGGFDRTLEKLYEFIDLGGINNISLENWRISDDTILHIKTALSILQDFDNIDQLGKILKKNYLDALNQFEKEGFELRLPGLATLKSLNILRNGGSWDNIPYDIYLGGAGASMRCLCIGLAFYGEENRYKLIQISIEASRITHNSAVGYLGGMTSALFTALAIEGKPINLWPFILLDLFKIGLVHKYIKTSERGNDTFLKDYHIFVDKWHRYIEDKFDDNKQPIKRKSGRNLVYRGKYYSETFGYRLDNNNEFEESSKLDKNLKKLHQPGFIGSGGDDSVIIAYDCLIDSGQNWEKLVIYSMLHIGDTDTTGAIAGGFYGALYGFNDVPPYLLNFLEDKKKLIKIGKKLFDKFHK